MVSPNHNRQRFKKVRDTRNERSTLDTVVVCANYYGSKSDCIPANLATSCRFDLS